GIERVVWDFVVPGLAVDALQTALDAVHAQGLLVALLRRHRHDTAPIAGRAVADDLEQVEPLVGIGKIVAGAETPGRWPEIEICGDLDETLGPGEALELDVGV